MANYTATTTAGTSRRRAKQIIINNPVKREFGAGKLLHQQPSVIFVMEDRIVMADGSETLIPAGQLELLLDDKTLSTLYPSVDVQTGAIDAETLRYGAQIMAIIIDGLEDVFVTEGMRADGLLTPDDGTDLGSPLTEEDEELLVPVDESEDTSEDNGEPSEESVEPPEENVEPPEESVEPPEDSGEPPEENVEPDAEAQEDTSEDSGEPPEESVEPDAGTQGDT